ncbi:hypothetical protein K435DRAFT_741221 [Dendrothele bispora CBS 962.96]|uniref:Uncharacterized protein n=1 Tax=Dendrothele bispora (strain CBS 962.96) TaxID=1314807 RepID=A0A4S8MWV4_DENBC|nr:hypothetical protein K435DRAFT_741221 [Dendrothele bispora CBS 962.96]
MTKILALIIFPALSALGINFVLYHALASGFANKVFFEECAKIDNPYRLPYTDFPIVNQGLCVLISLFHSTFDPSVYPFMIWFMATTAPIVAFIALEARRQNRKAPFMVKNSTITGLLMQTLSFAFTLPLYWMFSVTSGVISTRPSAGDNSTRTVSKSYAQAVFFAILLGLVVPTVCMLNFQTPYATLAWQPFPAYVAIVQSLYLTIAGSSSGSGYAWIRALYVSCFIANAYVHVSLILPQINDLQTLQNLFVPTEALIDIAKPGPAHALHMIQWDAYIGLGSSILATFWFAKSVGQFIGLLLWTSVAVPALGPGAAFSAAALWRESSLHSGSVRNNRKGRH